MGVVEIRETSIFADWLAELRDTQARARIQVPIRRLSLGLAEDAKSVGEGVSELRIDYGPGYRVYFLRRADALIFLLCGGDKRRQQQDIRQAIELAQQVDEV